MVENYDGDMVPMHAHKGADNRTKTFSGDKLIWLTSLNTIN